MRLCWHFVERARKMRVDEARQLVEQNLESFLMEDGTLVYHTLSYLLEAQKGPVWKQYLLNPTISYEDAAFVVLAFLSLLLLRMAISGCSNGSLKQFPSITKNVARSLGFVRRGKLHKFGENVWYTLWHTTGCIWGLCVLYCESGTNDLPGWPRLHLQHPDGRWYWMASEEELSRGSGGWPLLLPSLITRNYYLFQLAFWMSCLAFINLETRRKDFSIMLLHHVVTIVLVLISYCCSFWKIGVVVLVLHDMGDVFLYLSKSLHYSRVGSGAVEISFASFVLVFFTTRLVIYPFYCVRPSLNTALIGKLTKNFVDSRWDIPGANALPGFLVLLQFLHVYWFWCIIKMVVGLIRAIRNGSREDCEDVRSEDEDEEEEEEERKKIQ